MPYTYINVSHVIKTLLRSRLVSLYFLFPQCKATRGELLPPPPHYSEPRGMWQRCRPAPRSGQGPFGPFGRVRRSLLEAIESEHPGSAPTESPRDDPFGVKAGTKSNGREGKEKSREQRWMGDSFRRERPKEGGLPGKGPVDSISVMYITFILFSY